MGNVFCRLAAKVITARLQKHMGELLRHVQLAFATKCGSEAIVHATRNFLLTDSVDERVLLELDYRNAFSSIHRQKLLETVAEYISEYYSFCWQAYRHPSHLVCDENVIMLERGAQQGDLLGSLLFSLTTLAIVRGRF